MLKLFSTLCITLLFTASVFPQWQMLNPTPSSETSFMGSAYGADKYMTVTQFLGHTLFTADGGTTWNTIPINTTRVLRSAFFVNENTAWIAGAFEALFKTTDGGFTWTQVPAIDTTKYDVFFLNENNGWCAGFYGFIEKTTNGGASWESKSITSLSTKTLYGICATDNNNVYVAGSTSTLYKSTNGGDSWSPMTAPFVSTDLKEIRFTSPSTGFVVGGSSRIAKTTDAGASWIQVNAGASVQLWSLSFNSSGTTGLASGASSTLLRTTNSGDSWTPVTGFPTGITFYSVRFGTDNIAYLSGSNGYYFKSTDAGASWTELSTHFTTSSINDVSFADNSTGYIVGINGFIAKSTDGGHSWTQQTSTFTGEINEVIAPSPNVAVAGCDGGVVLRTTNGGTLWEQIATGITGTNSDILAIDFINDSTGYVAAYNGITAASTDGGATWTIRGSVPAGNPWDMDMADDKFGWIAATGERIIRTSDGGYSWETQYTGGGLGTYGISFIDRAVGVAGGTGGNTFYTTNGGNNWYAAVTPPGNTVWGIHIAESPVYGTVALTACASGYSYISKDGGMNWTLEPRQTINTFSDICMTDAAHAWIVGNSGGIVAYFEPSNVPVEMNSFTASVNGNNVTLNWITATELNNKGFEIQRLDMKEVERTGTESWNKIGFVDGKGTLSESVSYVYNDRNLEPGHYSYRLKQIDLDGTTKLFTLDEAIEIAAPSNFFLEQNYPNPFNPSTRIRFNLPADEFVTLKIYNSLGQETAVLINENLKAGYHETGFSAANLPSGIYFYTLRAGNYTSVRKMQLIK